MEKMVDTLYSFDSKKGYSLPRGLISDSFGNVFIACQTSGTIVKLQNSELSIFCGNPNNNLEDKDGVGQNAIFRSCAGIAISRNNTLYVTSNQHPKVRSITPTGKVSTIYPCDGKYNYKDEDQLFNPWGIVVDVSQNHLYITDYSYHSIKKLEISTGKSQMFCGAHFFGDADGIGTSARFNFPFCIIANKKGDTLFVSDYINSSIRTIDIKTKMVKTLYGKNINGISFSDSSGIAFDGNDDLYVCNSGTREILKISTTDHSKTVIWCDTTSKKILGSYLKVK